MAHPRLRGATKEDSIVLDDEEDHIRTPAPRLPRDKDRRNTLPTPQLPAVRTERGNQTLNEDDLQILDEVAEAELKSLKELAAAQKKSRSDHRISNVAQSGPSSSRRGSAAMAREVSRTPTAKPNLPVDIIVISDDEGPETAVADPVTRHPTRRIPQSTNVRGPPDVSLSNEPSVSWPAYESTNSESTNTVPAPSRLPDHSKSGCIERELSIHAHQHLDSPIGASADHNREQTIPGRVDTTPAFHRSNAESRADNMSPTIPMRAKTRRSHDPSGGKVQQKQRAVKSVRRREDEGTRSRLPVNPQDQRSAREFVQPHKSQEKLRVESSGGEISERSPRRNRNRDAPESIGPAIHDFNALERPKTPDDTGEVPATVLPKDEQNQVPPSGIDNTDHPSNSMPECSVLPSIVISQQHHQVLQAPTAYAKAAAVSGSSGHRTLSQTYVQPETLQDSDSHSDLQTLSRGAQPVDTNDLDTARSAVEDCLRRYLDEQHEKHAYLMRSLLWRQRTCHETELRAQHRQRKSRASTVLPERYVQYASPFAGMPSIQVPVDKKSTNKVLKDISQEIFTKAKPKDNVLRSSWAAPTTTYKSDAVVVPPFKQYVNLKTSILTDNESKLLATPYFQDENYESRQNFLDALPRYYEMPHDEKGPLDLRNEQCRFYKESIEAFLSQIGISWNDILFWLLAPDEMIKQINGNSPESNRFKGLLLERSRYDTEEFERDEEARTVELFDRESESWQEFFSHLEKATTKTLRLSAIACEAVFQECDFSIWYLAQQSKLVQNHVQRKTKSGQGISNFAYRQFVCRVCYQHNCFSHGEIREVPEDSSVAESSDSDESSGSERPAHLDDDSDIEKAINYKVPVNPDALVDTTNPETEPPRESKPPNGKFNSRWWLSHSNTKDWDKRKPFFPCNHAGSCDQARCRCYRENITCEKSCRCSRSCNRRFPGCSCAAIPGKRVCGSKTCLCAKFERECDADLCGTCGATVILDPVNRYNEDVLQGLCCNVAIQRGVPKKTLLGHSVVHGFGLYVGEDIKQDEYIGEYTGETISVKEGDRRSEIYGYQQTMYLFKLNTKQEVDATYMGNKTRFINNADPRLTNCYPRNLLCNTVFRLALYASTDLKAGTELFFHYNYPKELTAGFSQPNQPKGKVVAVKQTIKQKAKGKPSGSSSNKSMTPSGLEEPPVDRSKIFKATEKARAAKAAKRAAMLAEQALQSSATSRSGPQRARKTLLNESNQYRPSRVSQLRGGKARKTTRRHNSQDGSNTSDTSVETDDSDHNLPLSAESQDIQLVQESDEEDEDFVLRQTQEDGDNSDPAESAAAEESDEETVPRRSGRARKPIPAMTPVVAVKRGLREKRKRPVVFNSDDE